MAIYHGEGFFTGQTLFPMSN